MNPNGLPIIFKRVILSKIMIFDWNKNIRKYIEKYIWRCFTGRYHTWIRSSRKGPIYKESRHIKWVCSKCICSAYQQIWSQRCSIQTCIQSCHWKDFEYHPSKRGVHKGGRRMKKEKRQTDTSTCSQVHRHLPWLRWRVTAVTPAPRSRGRTRARPPKPLSGTS